MPQVGYIETYADLKTAIADLLDRANLAVTIGMFIQLCEADMNRKLRHYKMVATSSATGFGGDPKVALPVDWLEARNIEINGVQYTYTSPDVIDIIKQGVGCAQDTQDNLKKGHYSFIDSCMEILPVPGDDYQIYMDYYARIPPLMDQADGKNWILVEAPDAYLYGALIHSAPYLRDDARIAIWAKMYGEAVGMLQGQSSIAMTSGSRLTRRVASLF